MSQVPKSTLRWKDAPYWAMFMAQKHRVKVREVSSRWAKFVAFVLRRPIPVRVQEFLGPGDGEWVWLQWHSGNNHRNYIPRPSTHPRATK